MGVNRRYNTALEAVGNGTADFLDESAAGIGGFACGLWNSYPRFITEANFGGSGFIRGFMNNMCTPNVPPPPQSPFTGGQCVGTRYGIRFEYEITTPSSPTPIPQQRTLVGNPGLPGAIQSIDWSLSANDSEINVVVVFQSGANSTSYVVDAGSSSVIDENSVQVFVFPDPGQPDTCGNPPPEYPDVVVNTGDFTGVIVLPGNDGTTIDVDIVYNPSSTRFPMTFNFGGIDVEINIGGIYFNFGGVGSEGEPGGDSNGNPTPFPIPRDSQRRPPYIVPRRPPNNEDDEEVVRPEDTGGEEDIGITLTWIKLNLTNIPTNAKTQFGDGAPNLYYAGWFEFTSDGCVFPRQPIHFRENIFSPPPGATGYAYTLYNGFKGQITEYTRKGG